MRLISLLLFVLLLAIQYPLWLGKGGWLRVWELNKQVEEQSVHNRALKLRNAKLEGEVKDLRDGTGAIEERARYELGMVRMARSSCSSSRRRPRSALRRHCRRRPIRRPPPVATEPTRHHPPVRARPPSGRAAHHLKLPSPRIRPPSGGSSAPASRRPRLVEPYHHPYG